jgi:NTE family protein
MTNRHILESYEGKTAFVFAGGGSLGAAQVGMLKALVQGGIRADLIVGASVGAINAAYFAGNPTMEGVLGLEKVWLNLKRADIFPLSALHGLLAFTSRRNSFISPDALHALIERELSYKNLQDAVIPIYVVTTDAHDGSEIILSKGKADIALMASTAIPGIFPPVKIGRDTLIDGGVTNNTPVPAAVIQGAERIIILPTGSPCATPGVPKGALPLILHALNLMVMAQLIRDIEYYGDKADIMVVPPLCPVSNNISDFSKSAETINRAMESTTKWLNKPHVPSLKVPAELYRHHHSHSNKPQLA